MPAIKVLPLCFSSVFTSDEIVHNGPSTRLTHKTSAASFPVSDSDFTPAHMRPGLTFEVLASIRRGGPTKKVVCFSLVFILALWC